MKIIKKLIQEPREAEYQNMKVYDNLDEYLKDYNDGKDFVRVGYQNWYKTCVNGQNYYSFEEPYYQDENIMYLDEATYNKLLEYCKKTYSMRADDLIRADGASCRVTNDFSSKAEVIDYMYDDKRSWLPQVSKGIDEDIQELNDKIKNLKTKIKQLNETKKTLYDKEYLLSMVRTEYTFDSQYYKSIKNIVGDNIG